MQKTDQDQLIKKSISHLDMLCTQISERCVGSAGNHQATEYFDQVITSFDWTTETQSFSAIDWHDGGASLTAGGQNFEVLVSPYSLGCNVHAKLLTARNESELEALDAGDKIILLYGELAREQLMPKNFVFYNPESHQRIIKLLEESGAAAFICATGRNASLAGGVYPFPLIEDGDFHTPSIYMTEEDGTRLIQFQNEIVQLISVSDRIPSKGENVIGVKGSNPHERIIITAHIDAKKGTPGAIDNGTGVVVLLLLSELLQNYQGETQIELVALNGEDYFCAPGQMEYIRQNVHRFDQMILNINIDGAGFLEGGSAFSYFNLPADIKKSSDRVINSNDSIIEGVPWPQSDHSIFVQQGVPAIAITSQWFLDHIDTQTITHTPKDHVGIVNHHKVVEIALAIRDVIVDILD
jgi:aminopeptidase YwaD